MIFNKGHRVRVTIASTSAPYYEPNPQTGAPISHFITEPGVAAINTIWHDANHASRVILPVVKHGAGELLCSPVIIAAGKQRPEQPTRWC